jgi:hypothetical protein
MCPVWASRGTCLERLKRGRHHTLLTTAKWASQPSKSVACQGCVKVSRDGVEEGHLAERLSLLSLKLHTVRMRKVNTQGVDCFRIIIDCTTNQ